MEKKLQKPHLIDYNLLIAQDLWQAHYQILLIILLKELKNECKNEYDKYVKHVELNTQIVTASLNTQFLEII